MVCRSFHHFETDCGAHNFLLDAPQNPNSEAAWSCTIHLLPGEKHPSILIIGNSIKDIKEIFKSFKKNSIGDDE
jgi:hypothetical protein